MEFKDLVLSQIFNNERILMHKEDETIIYWSWYKLKANYTYF